MLKYVWIVTVMFFAPSGWAEAVYPPTPEIRPEGMQQGPVGSCMAEAQTAAIENSFRARGMAVSVSSFHAHAYNWKDDTGESGIYQEYHPDDVRIFDYFGRIVPRYMLPEDGRGFFAGAVNRPAVSQIGVYDFEFPSAGQTGQSSPYYVFYGGYSNSIGVNQIKQWVREKRALTISIQGYLMSIYNTETGLLDDKWETRPVVLKDRNLDVDHAVAVVGFDDDLVAGEGASPGAFIVRNSWNENSTIFGADFIYNPKELNARDLEGFLRMRAKINSAKVETGYFAIPYQYIPYLASQGAGGARAIDLNYNAFYEAYVKFERRYSIRNLPFFCGDKSADYIRNTYPQLLSGLRSQNKSLREKSVKALSAITTPRVITRSDWSGIKFARVAKTDKVDRAEDFYNENFAAYYCARPGTVFGPSREVVSSPQFQSVINLMSNDVNSLSSWLATYKFIYNYLGDTK